MSKKSKNIEANSKIDKDKIDINRLTDYNILWFGIDKYGYVFCCRSEFTPHVPDSIIKKKDKIEILKNLFIEFLETKLIDNDIDYLTSKGIFYYDLIDEYYSEYSDDHKLIAESKQEFKKHPYYYKKITKVNPENPLHIDQLPEEIRNIIKSNIVKIDAHNTNYFFIPKLKSHKD